MTKNKRRQGYITDEVASTSKDLDIFTGWLGRMENPDPVLRTESNGKGIKLYDEISRDPHAFAVLQTRALSVVGKDWEVLPADEPTKIGRPAAVTRAQKIADFVTAAFQELNFDQFRQDLLQGILYGFYCAEVIWTVRDGAIVPDVIRGKHPRRFSFTMDRDLRLLTPADMIEGEITPERKFIVFTYGSSDNPYGQGLGQKLWWPVWFKKNGIKFWLIFLEKYGMPTAVGKYPPGTPPDQQDALMDALDAIQNETGIKIPDTMELGLMEASRQGTATYGEICDYMDRQISKTVLGQTLTTEVGSTGSYAAGKVHNDVRQDIIKADAFILSECLNNTLVKWIVDLNFPDVVDYPKFWIRTDEEKDLKALADRDKILIDVGLPMTKQYFYETYAIPAPEEGEEVVLPVTESANDDSPLQEESGDRRGERSFAHFAEADPLDPVDTMAAAAAEKVNASLDLLLRPAMDMVQGASSFAEIGERLYALYPTLDSNRFQELLGRAMSAAGLDAYGDTQ